MSNPKNPVSVRPSPSLRAAMDASNNGPTQLLNGLYDHLRNIEQLDAIRLTPTEQDALKAMLQGVLINTVAIQCIPQDLEETDCESLRDKLEGAGYGQVLATLLRYDIYEL
ncbi:MAG: hypothetical protein OIF55_19110 [Amphritea sp.]|nr:hypothetical protein [Amphritea sp.]